MAPANRQSVARWMREVDARSAPQLSPYLAEAYHFANDVGTPVILALDLEDAVTLAGLQERLQTYVANAFLAQHSLQAEQVAKVLVGIRGITLGMTFNEQPFGKIKVDFRDSVTLSPEAAKAALLFALGNHGAMIDEFEDWKPGVSRNQITLEGHLGESGLRRISSLFNRPPSLKVKEVTAAQQAKSQDQVVLEASQAYFAQVSEFLKDLVETMKGSSSYTMAQLGVWMDKYASKIDQLSVLYVDPELVDYGAQVSDMLRDAYNEIRSGAARSRVRQGNTEMQYNYYSSNTTYGYTYRQGYFAAGVVPYGSTSTVAVPNQLAYQHERTRARTEERVASGNQARGNVENIKKLTADTRRRMTQKYNADF